MKKRTWKKRALETEFESAGHLKKNALTNILAACLIENISDLPLVSVNL
jgi:hypothetical protein